MLSLTTCMQVFVKTPFTQIFLHATLLITGCTVVWWVTQSPHSWGLSFCPWCLSGNFSFLLQPKNIHVRLISDSKLTVGVSVRSCLSCLSLCGHVMPSRVFPCLEPNSNWDRLQFPCDPQMDKAGIENGWIMVLNSSCLHGQLMMHEQSYVRKIS